MSDLFEKEKMIESMWNLFDSYGNNASVFSLEETEAINMFCSRLQSEIESQPIAYDVDKVVGKLEHYRLANEMSYEFGYPEAKERAKVYAHTIEIVKGGGVNEIN